VAAVRWHKQGAAFVGEIIVDGKAPARVVLVGPRSTPKGAVLVTTASPGAQLATEPFFECVDRVAAGQLVEVICMQERLFGQSKLPPAGL
jgi:hypothetical protein